MTTSEPKPGEAVRDVHFSEDTLSVDLADGRTITVPLVWYPRLLDATPEQRRNWQIIGAGYGIHWPDVDEDLSTEGLLRGAPAPRVAAGVRQAVAQHGASADSLRSAALAAELQDVRPHAKMTNGDELAQRRVCRSYATEFVESSPDSKIGIARNARPGEWPLNGLRHPPEGGTCGWYIWAGDTLSADPDFFEPHHVSHVLSLLPLVLPYLGLPPGWRFLLADNHKDVWYDPKLLQV